MSELLKLADNLEAATGPDRELDRAIAMIAGWCLHPHDRQRDDSAQSDTGYTCLDCGADSWGNTGPTGQKRNAPMPAYTASLDAAMTLVPEGWRNYQADFSVRNRVHWMLEGPKTKWSLDADGERCAGDDWFVSGVAVTPALAIAAAALRARDALTNSEGGGE